MILDAEEFKKMSKIMKKISILRQMLLISV